jgi:hypothetical protein
MIFYNNRQARILIRKFCPALVLSNVFLCLVVRIWGGVNIIYFILRLFQSNVLNEKACSA